MQYGSIWINVKLTALIDKRILHFSLDNIFKSISNVLHDSPICGTINLIVYRS
nr:MAG TPA: hypothetical protein [Bacteriophage sp.]